MALLRWRARVSTAENLSGIEDAGMPVLNWAVKGRWSEKGGNGVSVVWETRETAGPRCRMWSIHRPSCDGMVGKVVVGWGCLWSVKYGRLERSKSVSRRWRRVECLGPSHVRFRSPPKKAMDYGLESRRSCAWERKLSCCHSCAEV